MKNNDIKFIDGYLQALSDMNTGALARALLNTEHDDILLFVKDTFLIDKFDILAEVSCAHCVKTFSILEQVINLDFVSNDIKRYILSHLSDYIDFYFDDIGYSEPFSDNRVLLLKSSKDTIMVLSIRKKSHAIVICVFDKNNESQLIKRFNIIKEICQKEKEDNIIFENDLLEEINKNILQPIVKRCLKNNYLSETDRLIMLKYLDKNRVDEFENLLDKGTM